MKSLHDAKLREVAERLQRTGYEVIVEPKPADLPFNLEGYQPDLLARKEHDQMIVEVKSRADRLSVDQLRSTVEEVKRHPGWRFVLITAQDIPDDAAFVPVDDSRTWDDAHERIKHARNLRLHGEIEAAYLVLWIAFERMMRAQAKHANLPIERLPPSIVIRQLYSMGELSMEQLDAALFCQNTRNRVVHGLNSPELEVALNRLESLLNDLLLVWGKDAGGTSQALESEVPSDAS
jgi:Holliday junction resolvase